MMTGNSDYHEQLEQELATFVGKETGMLLNFGYQGIMSVIDALVDRKDVIVYDAESHACIIDGLRLHMGKRFVYPHNDINNLEIQLGRLKGSQRNLVAEYSLSRKVFLVWAIWET